MGKKNVLSNHSATATQQNTIMKVLAVRTSSVALIIFCIDVRLIIVVSYVSYIFCRISSPNLVFWD